MALLLDAPHGGQIPLDQVAKIGAQDGVINISREAERSTAAIGVFIKGRDMGGVVAEMQSAVKRISNFPPLHHYLWRRI